MWKYKYEPKKIEDFIGNKRNLLKIKDWIIRRRDNVNGVERALAILGPNGIGKTTIANILLKEHNYNILTFAGENCRGQKILKEEFNKLQNSRNIVGLFKNEIVKNAVLFDNVDTIPVNDKGGLNELILFINPLKSSRNKKIKSEFMKKPFLPVICIGNNNYSKKMGELYKECCVIYLNKPTKIDLFNYGNKIAKLENFEIDDNVLFNLIEISQYDIRKFISCFEEIYQISNKKNIIYSDFEKYNSTVLLKTIDTSIFETTNLLVNKKNTINEKLRLYDIDKSLLPLMIHENYLEIINTCNKKKSLRLACDISNNICIGDVIDNIIFSKQSWELQDIHGMYSTVIPSIKIESNKKRCFNDIKFTKALGKISNFGINNKNLNIILNKLEPYIFNKNNIFILKEIIVYNFFQLNDLKTGTDYMKKYYLDIDDLEKLIKIDRIKIKYKELYTSQFKTKLKKYFI
jgi:DNA polymerase III delta prime subunit